MKMAFVQILLSLIIGFALGTTFDKLQGPGCPCAKSCHSHSKCGGPCHKKDGKCGKGGCKSKCHGDCKKMKERMLNKFSTELSLTPEQKTKVAGIFEAKHKKMKELREEIRPKFEALRKSTESEIKQILTSEQQKKFDVIHAKWESKRKEWHPGPPPEHMMGE